MQWPNGTTARHVSPLAYVPSGDFNMHAGVQVAQVLRLAARPAATRHPTRRRVHAAASSDGISWLSEQG